MAKADNTQMTDPHDIDADARPASREPTQTEPPSGSMRDAMANERTLLAWVRTSISLIGLGFVVAKFALFLRTQGATPPSGLATTYSTLFGSAIVLMGTALMAPAIRAYSRREQTIEVEGYQQSPLLGWVMGLSTIAIGISLTVYLLITD